MSDNPVSVNDRIITLDLGWYVLRLSVDGVLINMSRRDFKKMLKIARGLLTRVEYGEYLRIWTIELDSRPWSSKHKFLQAIAEERARMKARTIYGVSDE